MEVYNLDDEEEKVETKIIHQSTIARPTLFLRDDPQQASDKKLNGAHSLNPTAPSEPRTDEEIMENRSNVKLFKKSEAETTTVHLKQEGALEKEMPKPEVEPLPAP